MAIPSLNEIVYFELNPECKIDVSQYKYRCSNFKCEKHQVVANYKVGNFCSECGSKIRRRLISTTKQVPNLEKICTELSLHRELMFQHNNIWIYMCPHIDLFKLDDEDRVIDLSTFNSDDIWKSIEGHKNTPLYKDFLKLKERFGDDIQLKFGVHLR